MLKITTYYEDSCVVEVEKDGVSIRLSPFEVRLIDEALDEVYYKEDVMNEINSRVQRKELPAEALKNEQFIMDVWNSYSLDREFQRDHDDSWGYSLDVAFRVNPYSRYEEGPEV